MKWMQIVGKVLAMLSPEIKAEISIALDKVQEHAKTTKLPFDDITIMVFRGLTGL